MSKANTNIFEGGVWVPYNKITKNTQIQTMPAPDTIFVPLPLHGGKQFLPQVKVGDTVSVGQLIARDESDSRQRIHSSVSGTVTSLTIKRPTPSGIANHIEIKNDFLDTTTFLPVLNNPSIEQIRERVFECGIVGMGGGGFPTHIKANVQKSVDYLIVNGIECEPYITCDYKLMKEKSKELIIGAKLLAKCTSAKQIVICIKSMNRDIADVLNEHCKDESNITVKLIQGVYPLGSEKHLIFSAVDRIVPQKCFPVDVGVVVFNVATIFATYEAVHYGIPCYRRVVTVTGSGIVNPADFYVRFGTPFEDILKFVGYNDGQSNSNFKQIVKLIAGGPMMGQALPNDQVVVNKTINCVLALTDEEIQVEEASECINCSACAKACPMKLMPMFITQYGNAGDLANSQKYGAKDCILCGCCSFVCPAKIPLVQQIRDSKKKIELKERKSIKK